MVSWGVAGAAGRCARVLGVLVTLVFVPAAFAAPASAASLTVGKPCYVNTLSGPASMTVQGSGFAPGDQVTITSSDGSVGATATATASGTITTVTQAPDLPFTQPGQQTVTLTASDFPVAGPEITATTAVTVAPLLAATQPAAARFTTKVTWHFSGFEPGQYVYAHYVHKRQVALARFGRAQGACGLLAVKARLYPGGHPRFRSYRVQFDDSRRYSKDSSPRLVELLKSSIA